MPCGTPLADFLWIGRVQQNENRGNVMKRNTLGRTGIEISSYCLGTMTFGSQTVEADSHRQMDMALAAGIDFFDAAEMYPTNPIAKETVGDTERQIGNWFATQGKRDQVVMATKITGAGMKLVRDGAKIDASTIATAVEGSLKRLKTDYIDLYQFHWPNRGSYMFRQNWNFDPSQQNAAEVQDNMVECLEALQKEVDRGTIRAFGLSNESCWGTGKWLANAVAGHGPRVASIQNEYSLMCRLFDTDLAELCVNEDVGLLAFSPLAAGLLTGKYLDGQFPKGSRGDIDNRLSGRNSTRAPEAVAAYKSIAEKHGLDLIHMALAWCDTRPFMASVIFGATTVAQLEHILQGLHLELSDEVMRDLANAHKRVPMPY